MTKFINDIVRGFAIGSGLILASVALKLIFKIGLC